MNRSAPLDPFAELLRQSPRGSAALLATGAQTRLRDAPTLTLALLKTILLTMIIPAEALARRIILALAAGLMMRVPANTSKPAPPTSNAAQPPVPQSPKAAPCAAAFNMQEKLPPVRAPKILRTETIGAPATPAAPSALSPEEKLLNTIWVRLGAVLRALHDPDAEALRFLRRHRARKGRARPPLAFGAPPGLKSADPQLTICLRGSDRDAEAAWSRLCDTS